MDQRNANLQELQMQFEYFSQQIEDAKRQLNEVRSLLDELQETLLAIVELEANPKNSMVSLGANAFVKSKISSDKIIVPIGANVLCEKTPAEARAILEERGQKLASVASNIEKALAQLLQMRQSIMQQAQQGQK